MRTLKHARQLMGCTQQQLATLVGMSHVQLCNIERGKHYPNQFTRKRLEDKLGSIDWKLNLKPK